MTIRKVLEQIHGNYPNSEYYFEEDGFRYYNTSEIIPYKGIYRLVEDKQYLYIYTSSQSAYMVNKLTVSDGRTNNLKKYLSEKTNQVWTSPFSIWTFGFLTILQKIRSRKQSYL